MKAWMWCAFVALFAAPVWAQGGGADGGQERMIAWAKSAGEFVAKERFSEADLKLFLEHYQSFNRIGDDSDEEFDDRFFKDGKFRFDLLLEDKEYVKWASDHGVDRVAWLKKSMRIITVIMKRQVAGQFEGYEKMLADQLADLEESKDELGEETYAQMKQELEASVASVKRMKTAFQALPDPTEDEAKLLEKYKKELSRVMEDEGCGEEEDEGCGCGDDDGCGEDEGCE